LCNFAEKVHGIPHQSIRPERYQAGVKMRRAMVFQDMCIFFADLEEHIIFSNFMKFT